MYFWLYIIVKDILNVTDDAERVLGDVKDWEIWAIIPISSL